MADTTRSLPASTRSSLSASSSSLASSSSAAASSWADDDDSTSSVSSPRPHPSFVGVRSLVVTFVPASAERLLNIDSVAAALRDEFARLGVSSRSPLVALRYDGGSDLDDASVPLRFDVRFGTTGDASRALDAAESATGGVLALSQVHFNPVAPYFALLTSRGAEHGCGRSVLPALCGAIIGARGNP
jgi:hypothetical protein